MKKNSKFSRDSSIKKLKDDDCKISALIRGRGATDVAINEFGEDRINVIPPPPITVEDAVEQMIDSDEVCAVIIRNYFATTENQGYYGNKADKVEMLDEPLRKDEMGWAFVKTAS